MYPARVSASCGSSAWKETRRSSRTLSSATSSRAKTKRQVRRAERALPSSKGWKKHTSRKARAARAVSGRGQVGSFALSVRQASRRARASGPMPYRSRPPLAKAGRLRSGGGPGVARVRPHGGREPFGDVLDQHRVGAGPALESAADRPRHQMLGVVGPDAPAAEEPFEHLMAVPVPAAAAAGPVGDVQNQVAGGAVPQDPLVVDAGQVQRVGLEPCGQALQPLAPLAQPRGHTVEGLVHSGDRVLGAAPAADRSSVEVPLVVRPPPSGDPAAVVLGQGVRHGLGPGSGLVPAPLVQGGPVTRRYVGTAGHPLGRPERSDHPRRRLAVERMTGGIHLVPGQIAGGTAP